jgi:hypothetical protein
MARGSASYCSLRQITDRSNLSLKQFSAPVVIRLAERGADADGGGDGSEREIEAACPARQIGDHQDRYNAKDFGPYTVQNLNRREQYLLDVSV